MLTAGRRGARLGPDHGRARASGPGPLDRQRGRRRRRRRRDLVPAADRRSGRPAARRDLAAGLRLRGAGDHGGGRAGQSAPDRAHYLGFGRTGQPPGFALSVHHRLHQPRGDRHPGAAVRRLPGRRPVQRGDRVPASLRCPAGCASGTGPARPRRAEPPDLGTLGAGGRQGRAARPARHPGGRDRAAHRAARRLHPPARHGAVVLPALLLRPRRGGGRPARGGDPRRGSGPAGDRTARAVRRPPGPPSRPSCPSAAARGTPRRRWTCSSR